jgi:hypothetical protein
MGISLSPMALARLQRHSALRMQKGLDIGHGAHREGSLPLRRSPLPLHLPDQVVCGDGRGWRHAEALVRMCLKAP